MLGWRPRQLEAKPTCYASMGEALQHTACTCVGAMWRPTCQPAICSSLDCGGAAARLGGSLGPPAFMGDMLCITLQGCAVRCTSSRPFIWGAKMEQVWDSDKSAQGLLCMRGGATVGTGCRRTVNEQQRTGRHRWHSKESRPGAERARIKCGSAGTTKGREGGCNQTGPVGRAAAAQRMAGRVGSGVG